MEIEEYQAFANQYPDYIKELGPYYIMYNLFIAAGNLSEKLKNILDKNDVEGLTDQDRYKLAIIIGDIFKILTDLSKEIDIPIEEILRINMKKLILIKEQQVKNENINKS